MYMKDEHVYIFICLHLWYMSFLGSKMNTWIHVFVCSSLGRAQAPTDAQKPIPLRILTGNFYKVLRMLLVLQKLKKNEAFPLVRGVLALVPPSASRWKAHWIHQKHNFSCVERTPCEFYSGIRTAFWYLVNEAQGQVRRPAAKSQAGGHNRENPWEWRRASTLNQHTKRR